MKQALLHSDQRFGAFISPFLSAVPPLIHFICNEAVNNSYLYQGETPVALDGSLAERRLGALDKGINPHMSGPARPLHRLRAAPILRCTFVFIKLLMCDSSIFSSSSL